MLERSPVSPEQVTLSNARGHLLRAADVQVVPRPAALPVAVGKQRPLAESRVVEVKLMELDHDRQVIELRCHCGDVHRIVCVPSEVGSE